MFAPIRRARQTEANEQVESLTQKAQQFIEAKQFDDAIETLNKAKAVPYSTHKVDVAAMIRVAQEKQTAEMKRKMAAAEAEVQRRAAVEAARKAEEEYEQNGLVLLNKTLKGTGDRFGGKITGIVINRRNKKLSYAQISFNLYDESGAQVGSALDNINGLEPGGRWKFEANSFGTDFSTYKINEMTSY